MFHFESHENEKKKTPQSCFRLESSQKNALIKKRPVFDPRVKLNSGGHFELQHKMAARLGGVVFVSVPFSLKVLNPRPALRFYRSPDAMFSPGFVLV